MSGYPALRQNKKPELLLRISYLNPHMGVALSTPELTAITKKLAKKYNLGISTLNKNTFYGEDYKDMWAVPIETKKREFMKYLNNLKPGRANLVILHIAHLNPEMKVLEMNSLLIKQNGIPMAARHRQTELNMLLSPEFQNLIGKKFQLITYADLLKKGTK